MGVDVDDRRVFCRLRQEWRRASQAAKCSTSQDDWPRVASQLIDKNVAPIGEVTLQPGEGSCDAVLRALKFRERGVLCAASMQTLIDKLNPDLPKVLPDGSVIKYPNLPVGDITWTAAFDSNVPGDADRLKMVTTGPWAQIKTAERRNGSLTQVEMKGYRATIEVPDSRANNAAIESVERYNPVINRSDIRASKLTAEPIAKSPFSSNAQQSWYKACITPKDEPSLPKPAFMNFLMDGDAKNDKCVANCVEGDRCPEIVLVDKAVAPHPDIAKALGLPMPASPIPLCSNVWWNTNYHATHLAGIMVGADNSNSFVGLSPNSKLTSFDYDKSVGTPGIGSSALVKTIREKSQFRNSRTIIFVFASKFNNIQDLDPELSDPRLRRERPPFIPEILSSDNLWVVAAGQRDPYGKNIDFNTPSSPMNLGDTSNVLVVTSCEDCLTDDVTISSWANYSRNLVNVAAPGGSAMDSIPAPATATEYSQTYGTSQAAAMVGGLAAAMASCYPDAYKNGKMLKIRLQTTSKPIVNPGLTEKVTTGIINAKAALLDPRFHWITVHEKTIRKARELQWCRDKLVLKQPDNEDPVHDGVFPSDRIRQIYRHVKKDAPDEWYFLREPRIQLAAEVTPTGPGVLYDNDPLLRVRYDDGTLSDPLRLDQIDGLVVGLSDAKVSVKACGS